MIGGGDDDRRSGTTVGEGDNISTTTTNTVESATPEPLITTADAEMTFETTSQTSAASDNSIAYDEMTSTDIPSVPHLWHSRIYMHAGEAFLLVVGSMMIMILGVCMLCTLFVVVKRERSDNL